MHKSNKRQEPITQAEMELRNDIAALELDPLGFAYYAFPWGTGVLTGQTGPDKWQVRVLSDIRDKLQAGVKVHFEDIIREAVASGHGIGKSALVSWLILWALSTREKTRGVVTANTATQLKTKTWAELGKWYNLLICKHWFTHTATSIYSADPKLEMEWRIDAVPWSLKNTEAFQGLHNQSKRLLLIFDEASAIEDKIWEVAEGALTDKDTQIIWCVFGNPTRNIGRFRECWRKFRKMWTVWQVDSRDAKMTNKKLIQEMIDTYGIDSDYVKVRVRGMFPAQSIKQFISTEDVDKAFGRHLRVEQYNFAPKIISVESAWEGDDELVIGMRQGLAFKILRTMPKNDNDITVANIVAQYEDMEQADAVFIDAGYGTGIYSAGQTWGRDWQLVWFAGESADPGCLNKRAEMWKQMRDWVKAGGAIPGEDHILYNDLIGPETVPRTDGKIQLEAKHIMKARGIPSPNRADALAITFAYPVQKKYRGGLPDRHNQDFARADYDVLDGVAKSEYNVLDHNEEGLRWAA